MRMRFQTLVLLLTVLLLSACVPSLHPLYTEKDLTFDQALLGKWQEKGETEIWQFTADGELAYHLRHVDEDGQVGHFSVHMLELQGEKFLDIYPDEMEKELNDLYEITLIPAHLFIHVRQIVPELQMRMIDLEKLKKVVKNSPHAIAFEKLDDGIVLTAATVALQKFVVARLQDGVLFGAPSDMRRID